MRSDLILMIFDRQVDAQRVYYSIQSMRHSQILGLDKAIVVTRDSAGGISLTLRQDVPDTSPTKGADLRVQIANLLFSPDSEERNTALVKLGLDERFEKRVIKAMDAGKSALLALLRYDDIADRDELLRVLALFRGQILHTTISTEH